MNNINENEVDSPSFIGTPDNEVRFGETPTTIANNVAILEDTIEEYSIKISKLKILRVALDLIHCT